MKEKSQVAARRVHVVETQEGGSDGRLEEIA
jgi:hypothetical protein